jgi:hypothetical protein
LGHPGMSWVHPRSAESPQHAFRTGESGSVATGAVWVETSFLMGSA